MKSPYRFLPSSRFWATTAVFSLTLWLDSTLGLSPLAQAAERPNIVYIMSDDMGFSDIGCYGSEIETPHLDRLAGDGMRFSQFYNMARCCPTRACLLTGLYPHQAGVGWMMNDSGHDGYRGELNRNCVTLAEVLRTAGYGTYMSGKWHVTKEVKPESGADKHNWPLQRGFDHFYGTIHGAGSFFDPFSLTRDNQYISPAADPEYQPAEGFYYTDAIAEHAVRFIQKHQTEHAQQPFFLYVSFTAAHWPMHAREDDIAKYSGRYDVGYEAIRKARFERMLELGLITAQNATLWPMDESWMESDEFREWDIRNMEVYAAMIDRMDQGIGRIVEALDETGKLENTLLLFFQDNGGCAENYGRSGEFQPRADAPSLPPLADNYLQPDMQPKQTRDGYPVRTGKGVLAGPPDTYIGYGNGWATVSNTPFREYKHWVHEGGISTPLIAHWPASIRNTGSIVHTPGHLVDLMATAVDISGATYPTTFHDGQAIKPMEGKSLLPAFHGEEIHREAIYFEHEGNRAIRKGDYKLCAKGADGPWELYNIALDRSEQHDLASQQPDRVNSLAAMWQTYAERADVLPITPYYNKDKSEKFKKNKVRFELQQGDDLNRNQAPYVPQRGIAFSARLSQVAEGVLVAQGGVTNGWAVYCKDEKLCFATTRSGKRQIVQSEQSISGAGVVLAEMDKQGKVVLRWNEQIVGQGNMPGLLAEQPADGLQIGHDAKGSVGDYAGEFRFSGEVSDVVIKLEK